MTSGELNYRPEVVPMVKDMQKWVAEAERQMQVLATNVTSLATTSASKAVAGFTEMHQQWDKLMQEHNRVLNDIASTTLQGYEDMLAFDHQTAAQISQPH